MVNIPIDLTGEQKTVLAIFSIRQIILVGPLAAVTLFQFILFDWPFVTGLLDFFVRTAVVLVVNGITFSLAFIKIEKYDMYLSDYIQQLILFRKSQKIYTN